MALRTIGLQLGVANGLAIYIRSSPLRFHAHRTERRQVGNGLHCSLPPGGSAESSSPESKISESIDEKERLRRQRISIANAGRQTWNKGRKHSPETIAKIRERTKQAMQRPEVSEKVKAARSGQPGPTLDPAVRARISEKLKAYYAEKRAEKAAAAATATDGGSGSGAAGDTPPEPPAAPKRRRALSPSTAQPPAAAADSDAALKEHAPAPKVLPKPKRKTAPASATDAASETADPPSPPPPQPLPRGAPRRRGPASPEHRAAISEAIRRKWQDPEYRASTVSGMRRVAGSDRQDLSTSGHSTSSRSSGAGGGYSTRASMPGGSGWAAGSSGSGTGARRKAGGGGGLDVGDGDPLVGDLSAVRSTRTARGGGRRMAVVQEQAAGGAAAVDGEDGGDTGTSSSGGGGGSVGRSRTKAHGVSGRARASATPEVDDENASAAARLAHVQRLVRQVLVAQRLVATTEMLVRQVAAKMDALRNDPVVRSQAEAQLASVRATLTVAKAKLDMLRRGGSQTLLKGRDFS